MSYVAAAFGTIGGGLVAGSWQAAVAGEAFGRSGISAGLLAVTFAFVFATLARPKWL